MPADRAGVCELVGANGQHHSLPDDAVIDAGRMSFVKVRLDDRRHELIRLRLGLLGNAIPVVIAAPVGLGSPCIGCVFDRQAAKR